MGKLICCICICSVLLVAGCGPGAKEQFHPRYIERANKDIVFKESVNAIRMAVGGIDKSTDKRKGYISSIPYPPPVRFRQNIRIPTRYVLEVMLREHNLKGKTFYTPEFNLVTIQSKDRGKTWVRIPPPRAYKSFIEEDLRKRVITIISGLIDRLLPGDCFIGFIIITVFQ